GPSGARRVGGKGRSFGTSSSSKTDASRRMTALTSKTLPTQQRTNTSGFTPPKTIQAPTTRGTYTPAQPRNVATLPKPVSEKKVTNWVDQLRKSTKPSGKGPKLPGQVNLNQYRTEIATIKDIAKKYGFDYSREYAERQAAILAQAQRDEIET